MNVLKDYDKNYQHYIANQYKSLVGEKKKQKEEDRRKDQEE